MAQGLIGKFSSVGGATLASRLLGFVRESLMAAALGAGPVADAFYAAFRFPNLFRRLFAEGAFNAAFVPLFAKELEAGGRAQAEAFSREVFGILFTILLALTIAMELAMPLLVATVIAPGFTDDADKFDLTVRLALVMFPYLMCMSLGAMMAGILNSLGRYFIAAIAPVFLNIILSVVLVIALWRGADAVTTGHAMAWGVLAAGLVQLLLVTVAVRREGITLAFRRPRLTPNVRRMLWLALPAAITGGITQINLVIGQMIASGKDGAISVLQYADRLYQLPLGVVGIAVGVVLLPELSRALRSGNVVTAGTLQNRSVEFALFLTLPCAAALLAIAEPVIRLLYERGAFSPQTTDTVSGVLAIFGLGLPAFVLIKAFTPGFFAREDTATPMRIAGVSVVTNTALALLLFPVIAERGIAVAEIVAGWVNAALLFVMLRRRGHWPLEAGLLRRLAMLTVSAAVMGVALAALAAVMEAWFRPSTPLAVQMAGVAILVAAGAAIYLALAFATGGADRAALMRNLRRGPRAPA